MKRIGIAFVAILTFVASCGEPPDGPGDITGASTKYAIEGKYAPIAIDRVDALSVENGKLVIHGSSTTLTEDLPEGADASKPEPHWSLTTETDNTDKRVLTFTHNMSLDDFSIQIPKGSAVVHYGTLRNAKGDEVMLLAWGELAHSFWGYVTIAPKTNK